MRLKLAFTYPAAFFIVTIGAMLLFACTKITFTPQPKPPVVVPTPPNLQGKPNIILILADDIGYEVPSYTGGQSYNTPNLDRLAAGGLQFTNCFAMPLSSPSRFMLTTGKYNFRNYTKWGSMNPSEVTIANLMHNAGYATCVSGKWQFDGGDASIKAFGYDKYCVWDTYKSGDEEEADSGTSYKDPLIYENGANLPASQVAGQYGVDICNRYVMNFIDSNKAKPFFIYYPIPIAHAPFSPTPDDIDKYPGWKSTSGRSDTLYYRSMVQYMDKLIDSVVEKVRADGLENNTVILFTSDNGTPAQIISRFNNQPLTGGMGATTMYGTHVPLIAYCPGSVTPGVCTSFIDFTDFLPTVVGLANATVPATFVTDGVSFRNQLFEASLANRTYLYSYFFPHPEYPSSLVREYVQDTLYKYYDQGFGFYNLALDPFELHKINTTPLTTDQTRHITEFRRVIDSIHP